MFFHECDDYVDGGVLANNPSEAGLTAIHQFRGSYLPIALVVRMVAQFTMTEIRLTMHSVCFGVFFLFCQYDDSSLYM